MPDLLDEIARTIRLGVDTVVEKTEEFTRIGRIQLDILNIKRKIERNFTELGAKLYHLVVEEKNSRVARDAEVKRLIDKTRELEKVLHAKKEELVEVKAKQQAKSAREAGEKSTA